LAVIASARAESSDQELVRAVRVGDDLAFEELYRRYSRRVAGYVYRMMGDHDRAEDVTQEAFFSALRRLRQTDSEIVFKPWIFEIAKNAAIDQFRRTSRAEEVSLQADDGSLRPADQLRLVGAGPPPDVAIVHKERLDHLQGAFDELSESHHRILVMRELEGLSYREIGERMALTRPAVESTLFRARRRLNQEYAELDTGARCTAMSAAIDRLAEGVESARDRRRVGRHVRRCAGCRRHARELGVHVEMLPSVGSKVAALLPLPALFRRRREASGDGGAAAGGSHAYAATAQQAASTWAPTVATAGGEPAAAAWSKAAALVATLAIASGGATAVHKTASDRDGGGAAKSERAGAEPEGGAGSTGGELLPFALSPRGTERPGQAGSGLLSGGERSGSGSGTAGADRGSGTNRDTGSGGADGGGGSDFQAPTIDTGGGALPEGIPAAGSPDGAPSLGGGDDGDSTDEGDGDGVPDVDNTPAPPDASMSLPPAPSPPEHSAPTAPDAPSAPDAPDAPGDDVSSVPSIP
jgi:RNA polymerase sigma factor (sigma-70 family)